MKFLILLIFLLIAITWILGETEVEAERRTFDFFRKHHHKHRKEDQLHHENYLDDTDFNGYHHYASNLHYGGHYYPSDQLHAYGINGYGIGETGFHGGVIHSPTIRGSNFHGSNYHRAYFSGPHFESELFANAELENNLHDEQQVGVHGDYGEVHEFVGDHGSHLSHFG